jgi:aryl-alcohol dehydrogenase-like predicted oxidoreductase
VNYRRLGDSELEVSEACIAAAFGLREPNVASAIVGASRSEQVVENAAASSVELDDATLGQIEDVFA